MRGDEMRVYYDPDRVSTLTRLRGDTSRDNHRAISAGCPPTSPVIQVRFRATNPKVQKF